MTFAEFIDLLSIRVGMSAAATRGFALAFRDEVLSQLAEGHEIRLAGLGSFKSVVSRRRVCASNLPGRTGRRPVASRHHLKFAAYDSSEVQLGKLRGKLASGLVVHPTKRRILMAKQKDKKKRGRSIEVSVPADVSEITIKIEKTGKKKAESQGKRRLLG